MSKKRLYKGEFLQRKDPKSTASGYHAPPDKRSSHHAPSDKRSSHHAPSVRRSRHYVPPTRRILPYLQQLSHVHPAQLCASLQQLSYVQLFQPGSHGRAESSYVPLFQPGLPDKCFVKQSI
ncbi:hypothetical protein M6B38_154460 [Iris pallida]|uniref:Uncharacterized protein n=1 Tax=Iris pallida TaxID=29817 RepID=A0AAX6F4G2_IRIPA|nr:hypothetical protein M6B38_154460 [Iris pallida]